MTSKDWKEIGVTALVVATMAIGVFAVRPGMTDDPAPRVVPPQPSASVGPLVVTATAHGDAKSGTVNVDVNVQNPTQTAQEGKFNVVLVKRTFTGSPMARVVRPSDYQSEAVGQQELDKALTPVGHAVVPVAFRIPAPANVGPPSTYRVDIVNGAQRVTVSDVTFDPLAQQQRPAAQ